MNFLKFLKRKKRMNYNYGKVPDWFSKDQIAWSSGAYIYKKENYPNNVIDCPKCNQDFIELHHGEPVMCKKCGIELIVWGACLEVGNPHLSTQDLHNAEIFQILYFEDGFELYMNWLKRNCSIIENGKLKVKFFKFHSHFAEKSLRERQRIKDKYGKSVRIEHIASDTKRIDLRRFCVRRFCERAQDKRRR